MSLKYLSTPTKILADSITSAATSFRLNNITGWDGEPLTSGDFGTQAFGVFRNAAKTEIELFEYDPATIANSEITIVRRGLQYDGNLTTEVAGNKKAWNKGDTQVDLGTSLPQMFRFLEKTIEDIAISGGVNATTVLKGIGLISTAPVDADNPIFVGDNDPRIPTADQAAALAGGGVFGTPDEDNKFITQEGSSIIRTYDYAGSPHTWTKLAGLKRLKVQSWGAGASGAVRLTSNANQTCNGGSGGGYREWWFEASELGATETVTVGKGGDARTFTAVVNQANGENGGNSTFGSLLTAYGGQAGVHGAGDIAIIPGASSFAIGGGLPDGGNTTFRQGTDGGGCGADVASNTAGVAGASIRGGGGGGAARASNGSGSTSNGGASLHAGAGGNGAQGTNTTITATSGQVPAGGGGGAAMYYLSGGHTATSGAGGHGRVIVTEYYA